MTNEELKTLKDFDERNSPLFTKENLKQEAIKCAKYFDKKMEEADKGEIDQMGFLYWKGRFDEVMERNNLTEEELKNDLQM